MSDPAQWFGFKPVQSEDKEHLVKDVFSSVAESYDTMNDAMSFGIHRLWKRRLIRDIGPRANKDYLDVAGGTGDIAFKILEATEQKANVTVCDINPEMLKVGQNRAFDRGLYNLENLNWVEGNAETLPFDDNIFDVYTISFGLRNVTHINNALAEAYRVLKPGGRFYCLEFSKMKVPGIRKLYDLYSFNVIPRLGQQIANDRESYQYLVESIRQFPSQKQLELRLRQVGFKRVTHSNLSGGISAIHKAVKI